MGTLKSPLAGAGRAGAGQQPRAAGSASWSAPRPRGGGLGPSCARTAQPRGAFSPSSQPPGVPYPCGERGYREKDSCLMAPSSL